MSERMEGIEGRARSEKTLLSKTRDALSHPATLSLAALITILGVSKKVAADMVACVAAQPGEFSSLVADKVGDTNGDNSIQPTDLTDSISGDVPKTFKDRLFVESRDWENGGGWYSVFDPTLQGKGRVDSPEYPVDQIIGKNGIGVTPGSILYHLDPTSDLAKPYILERKGTADAGDEFQSYGGYLFYANLHDNGSAYVNMLNVIDEDDVLANTDPYANVPQTEIKVDDVSVLGTSGNGLAIDKSKSVVLVSTQRASDEKFGYIEVPLPELNANGYLPPPNTWGQTFNFVETGYEVNKIYVDEATGDRFLIYRENNTTKYTIHIETSDGSKYEIPFATFPSGIKMVNNSPAITVLPSGGLYIIGNNETVPWILKGTTNPSKQVAQGIPYSVSMSEDFPGNGAFGTIAGCTIIDPAYEPKPDLCEGKTCDDANICTTDSCDSATGDCKNVPDQTGKACDDGNPDTENDACVAEVCVGDPIQQPDLGTDAGEDAAPDVSEEVLDQDVIETQDTAEVGTDVAQDTTPQEDEIQNADEGIVEVSSDNGTDFSSETFPDTVEDDGVSVDEGITNPDTGDTATDQSIDAPDIFELPEELSELTSEEVAEALDNLQPEVDEDTTRPEITQDVIEAVDANFQDIQADINTPEGKGGGGGCSAHAEGATNNASGITTTILLSALAVLAGRRRKTIQ